MTLPNRLLSTDEAAEFLGMHRQWLDHARLDGRGPRFVRIGRICKYQPEDLIAFVKANTVETKNGTI